MRFTKKERKCVQVPDVVARDIADVTINDTNSQGSCQYKNNKLEHIISDYKTTFIQPHKKKRVRGG